jgi:hypothetical protein
LYSHSLPFSLSHRFIQFAKYLPTADFISLDEEMTGLGFALPNPLRKPHFDLENYNKEKGRRTKERRDKNNKNRVKKSKKSRSPSVDSQSETDETTTDDEGNNSNSTTSSSSSDAEHKHKASSSSGGSGGSFGTKSSHFNDVDEDGYPFIREVPSSADYERKLNKLYEIDENDLPETRYLKMRW